MNWGNNKKRVEPNNEEIKEFIVDDEEVPMGDENNI